MTWYEMFHDPRYFFIGCLGLAVLLVVFFVIIALTFGRE